LHDDLPIAVAPAAKDRRDVAVTWSMAVRQFFRPWVLAFLALALVVGGWGYGYKLSQYLHHSDVSKASATRMWVDHRDDSFEVRAHHQQHNPHKFRSSQFSGAGLPRLPHLSRELVFAAPIQSRILTFVSPLHPLRAPPTSISSLA
jgi:hypothetical protein